MAQTNSPRDTGFGIQITRDQESEDLDFWDQPAGIDYNLPPTRLGRNAAAEVKNWRLHATGLYRTRDGTSSIGSALTDTLIEVAVFQDPNGVEYLYRWLASKIQVYTGTLWVDLTVTPTPALFSEDHITTTAWGNYLLWSDGRTGMYKIDPVARTSVKIIDAPAARHITTFNGRVIASYTTESSVIYPYRMRWSANRDSDDWTGIGSGFEDFYASPGSAVDQQFGLYPVNDAQALVVRSNSIWLAQPTRDFDLPFDISILATNIHSDSPFSIVLVPGTGVIYLTRDDVKFATTGDIKSIGTAVRRQLYESDQSVERCIATFDTYNREYRIYFPKRTLSATYSASNSIVWRYSMDHNHWSRDQFLGEIRAMVFTNYRTMSDFDSLTGTFDELDGTFDELGVGTFSPRIIYSHGRLNGYVFQEVFNQGTDSGVANTSVITTGIVQLDPKIKQVALEAQAELYVADSAGDTVTLAYSTDLGQTWTNVSSKTLSQGQNTVRWSWRKNATYIQLRLTTVYSNQIDLQRFFVTAQRGPKINP